MATGLELEPMAYQVTDFHSYETGRVVGRLSISTGIAPQQLLGTLGLENCGIGGYHCTCNEDRLDASPTKSVNIMDFVDGVLTAKQEAIRGFKV